MNLSNEDLLKLYRHLVFERKNDERMCTDYARKGFAELHHSPRGEEATHVGCTFKLRKEDLIIPSLRSRAMFHVKGVSSKVMMAGAYGKRTGPAKGKNTSHHMGDQEVGVLAATGLIGSHLPMATGAALGLKLKGTDNVVVVSFGDGATSRGDFHESLNLASVWKLPVIFICENNGYAISLPVEKQTAVKNIVDRAAGYAMPGVVVDGNDVLAVFEETQKAVSRARKGEGPTLIECKTIRWRGHSENDKDLYRAHLDREEWYKDDPVLRYEEYLKNKGILTNELAEEILKDVLDEVEEAVKFADESPFAAPEEALGDVFENQ